MRRPSARQLVRRRGPRDFHPVLLSFLLAFAVRETRTTCAGRQGIEPCHEILETSPSASSARPRNEGPRAPVIAAVVEHRGELSTCARALVPLEGIAPPPPRSVAECSESAELQGQERRESVVCEDRTRVTGLRDQRPRPLNEHDRRTEPRARGEDRTRELRGVVPAIYR